MPLKAVLFDFNGVIINDEPIHERIMGELLLGENLQIKPGEFRQYGLGRSDRACLMALLENRGRVASPELLAKLLQRKAELYRQTLDTLETLPIYPGVNDLIFGLRGAQVKLALVSGAIGSEIRQVLTTTGLLEFFSAIVSGDEDHASKPAPDGYLKAISRLNQQFPDLALMPQECLVIEDTFAGIESAKAAGIQVVAVANTYPFHMLQRQANWTVDYLSDLELERVRQQFGEEISVA
jgi:beta-phosphoglucomutase